MAATKQAILEVFDGWKATEQSMARDNNALSAPHCVRQIQADVERLGDELTPTVNRVFEKWTGLTDQHTAGGGSLSAREVIGKMRQEVVALFD